MITYNKNTLKKMRTGNVNWDFYEDIDVYYKDRRTQMVYDDMYPDNKPLAVAAYSRIQTQTPPPLAQQIAASLPAITIKRRSAPNEVAQLQQSNNNHSMDESANFYEFKK